MKKRVVAFIDGFNVYHSVAELGETLNYLKWLDLNSLVLALMHPNKDSLASIEYFTSDAHWNPVEKRVRHEDYISALRSVGVNAHVGSFKSVKRKCSKCGAQYKAFEENGTDVAIAAKMIEFAHKDIFDKALLFSADSDLVPIIQSLKQNHPQKEVVLVTTKSRVRNAKNLRAETNGYISIDEENFKKNLLGPEVIYENRTIIRPEAYKPPAT